MFQLAPLANGDDTLELDLPAEMDLIQLLDLVGTYLHLDYTYDPNKIKNEVVTLKLHGKLQGEIRVNDLYPLLESVLKFKVYVMTRHKGNLVTIVPVADALEVDPQLVDPNVTTIEAGDIVVTRVFELQHLNTFSATNLLKDMRLGVAVSPVEETQSLIVTCYAHRISRIEQLLRMIDRPGRKFRFRQLKYTTARALARKIETLAKELGTVPVTIVSGQKTPLGPSQKVSVPQGLFPPHESGQLIGSPVSSRQTVYLDADERTNRILTIGYEEQLVTVEELVDALDVAPQDLRTLRVYDIERIDAEEVKKRLEEVEIIRKAAQTLRTSRTTPMSRTTPSTVTGATGVKEGTPAEEPQPMMVAAGTADMMERTVVEEPQVVVLAATNSLLINATEEQHAQIATIISYVDAEIREQAIPYEIHFLENQDPNRLAGVLEKVIRETIIDKEGKIEKVSQRTQELIAIVPDEGTYSLIVYANKKNQEWISKLIKSLDKRRPQVLIDVTLVEIRKTDEFDYDLNLITSFPDLIETGGQTDFFSVNHQTVVDKLLQPGMREQFIDFQSEAGALTGFYADIHVNALLHAMETKNYGRVLARPKVLVNDNETGTIKTADITYVTKKSSIPVTTGAGGQQTTLIETAIEYQEYDAGITLAIKPHISEGDLLRLDIDLRRSDFGTITGEKPPDKTSSDVKIVVTVPDGSTIILGGMLRLNQSRGGAKVPILGDLPLVGVLFRSLARSDIQSRLYVFVRAEIIRPAEALAGAHRDLERISEQTRSAFEKHEEEFQNYQDVPGLKSGRMDPAKVLESQ